MAVIEILGTDSLSSSRITLNDNFVELQDRIDDISNYLNTSAATLTNVAVTATQINVSGGSTLTNVTASDLSLSGAADFQGTVFKTAVEGSAAAGVTSFGATFSSHTYFVQDTGGATINLPAGQHGQEIMLMADTGGGVPLDATNISGVSTATLTTAGDAVSLRAIDDGTGSVLWYCVGKSGGANFS